MTALAADWPNDADGDVFRRLVEHRFDFSKSYYVDFNVDFAAWPPAEAAIAWLESAFGFLSLHPPIDDFGGYAQFQVHGPVNYNTVTLIQRKVTIAMEPFGGICESWGVMQDAP
jgi:hypothetical protein